MIDAIKYRWVFLILIWIGVLSLTKINSATISEILSNRKKIEVLRMDREFLQKNSGNIAGVLDQQKSLYHEIESLMLGQVALKDNIKGIVQESGLYEFKMEMDAKQSQDQGNSIPIQLSFKGQLKDGMRALNRVQKEYLYLSIQSINIAPVSNANESKFDIYLKYRYKPATGQKAPNQ
jgi:hypothetical protein